jgi:hypothetical protein
MGRFLELGLSVPELKSVVVSKFEEAFLQNSDQFFYNFHEYLPLIAGYETMLANAAVSYLSSLKSPNNPFAKDLKKVEDLIIGLSPTYLASLWAVQNYVCVGVDTSKVGFPTALYTGSIEQLINLHTNGQLEGSIDALKRLFIVVDL